VPQRLKTAMPKLQGSACDSNTPPWLLWTTCGNAAN